MAKIQGRVARRYARAIYESVPPAELDRVYDALKKFEAVWLSNDELRQALSHPGVTLPRREEVLRDVASKIESKKEFANFLSILLRGNRLRGLPEIAHHLKAMIDQLKKLLALEISTARELSVQEKEEIQSKIQTTYGSMASIDWKRDSELLGGMVVKLGDKLLDGSVRGTLEQLRAQLLA